MEQPIENTPQENLNQQPIGQPQQPTQQDRLTNQQPSATGFSASQMDALSRLKAAQTQNAGQPGRPEPTFNQQQPLNQPPTENRPPLFNPEEEQKFDSMLSDLETALSKYEGLTKGEANQEIKSVVQDMSLNQDKINETREQLNKDDMSNLEKIELYKKVALLEAQNEQHKVKYDYLNKEYENTSDQLRKKNSEYDVAKNTQILEDEIDHIQSKRLYESHPENSMLADKYMKNLVTELEKVSGQSLQGFFDIINAQRAYGKPMSGLNNQPPQNGLNPFADNKEAELKRAMAQQVQF